MTSKNSFSARSEFAVGQKTFDIFRLDAVKGLEKLPYSLKVLAENLLRCEDGASITANHIRALAQWNPAAEPDTEIQFTPARVLMQDFTGVPVVVDLAAMREAMADLGGDPALINPLAPAEMVIDHSVIVDSFGTPQSFAYNRDVEYERNLERYTFLRWGQGAFDEFRVVPPSTGICHQVNIEYLARGVMTRPDDSGAMLAYPDTLVGTDSHTPMANGLGVLGWGVGGIEAEAAMLGQPISMLIPRVVGFKLTGSIPDGVTATDVVLTIAEKLRKHGVVGKLVDFYGAGVAQVPLANRATIGNMSPEYGCTASMFPVDQVTLDYYRLTGRSEEQIALIEAYAKTQGLWHDENTPVPQYSEYEELDLGTVVPSIAGRNRPEHRISLSRAKLEYADDVAAYKPKDAKANEATITTDKGTFTLKDGAVGIAAITSCTNTSNPSVMLAAGLLAKKANSFGLKPKPWVKTSTAPGSKVVTAYYEKAGVWEDLNALGFNLVGYGCTTCIGNSGPLHPEISKAVADNGLVITAVLSGNRNFEGRISPDVAMNYLASPPLVVAYSLAGTMDFDFDTEPLGYATDGTPVFLRDIWPSAAEVQAAVESSINRDMFVKNYAEVFAGDEHWNSIDTPTGSRFAWSEASTYVRKPNFFDGMTAQPQPVEDIHGARVLALLGDNVTTDHISPAGAIKADSPAGAYLQAHGIAQKDFNSYGSRRGNHEVMVRGTFANIRLRNLLVEQAGGFTRNLLAPGEPVTSIFDASEAYRAAGVPLVVVAGKAYGNGSSRDWAAKGTYLLGVRAVIAESFERIHRSNLIGMGVLPLQFEQGVTAPSLGLDGHETFDIVGIDALNSGPTPHTVEVKATKPNGSVTTFSAIVRIDTPGEADYYRNGGILQYVLRSLAK